MHGRNPGTLFFHKVAKMMMWLIYKHASGRDWVKCWASPAQAPTTCQHFESTPCFTDQTPIPWTWQVAESIDVKMVIMASVACSFEARVLSASEVLPTTCHKRGNKGVTLEIHGNTEIWEYSESILKLHKHTLNMVESSMLPATFASVRLFTTVQHTQKLISPAKIFQQGYQKYSTCRTWSLPGAFTKNNTQSLDIPWSLLEHLLAGHSLHSVNATGGEESLEPWIHQTGEAAHPCQSPSCREPRNKHLCTGQLGSWEASSFWKKLQHSFAVWWVFLWWMHDEQHWTTTNAPETGQATRCTVWSVWFAASRVRHVALPLRFRLKICRVQESNDAVTSDSVWFYLTLLIDPFIAGIKKAQSDTVWLESCG